MEKKGQVAIEAIMIYGLAILVVILAIGALMYFGVLDLGSLLPDKCEIKGVAIICENYGVTKTGNVVQLELRNSVGKNIEITKVSITGETGTDMQGMWATSPANCTVIPTTKLLVNGEKGAFTLLTCTIGIPAGKKISGVIELTYNVVGSSINVVKQGTIRTTVS